MRERVIFIGSAANNRVRHDNGHPGQVSKPDGGSQEDSL
jgi:hypothetical protein